MEKTKLLTPDDEVIKERIARKSRRRILNKKQLADKIEKMKNDL